ncbi:helix-turn-helix transcriptional regulator [Streptomyces mirabilis]
MLIGREVEIGIINDLIDRIPESGGALLINGEPGIGKSSLLARAAERAQASGMAVFRASGVQTETHLPFAGLHQLLRTLQHDVKELPTRQSDALLGAFGMAEPLADSSVPEFFMIGLAVLNLLGEAATHAPLLLVVDDAQWLDRPTLDVLGFVARRLGAEPIGLLIAMREGHAGMLDDCRIAELALRPLDRASSSALLDARAPKLASDIRERVLAEAAGNPLALLELPTTLADGQAWAEAPPASPCVPLTARLERAFAARADDLPADTRQLLLVASLDDEGLLDELLAAGSILTGSEMTARVLTPALKARLIEVDERTVRFSHPLVRSAIYQGASLAERLVTHAALGEALDNQPDRRAWHRAAASGRRDETVAADLDAAAERARRRGALAVAVVALERAAKLSEEPKRRGARLLYAAELASELGRRDLVSGLLHQVESLRLGSLEKARVLWLREVLEEHATEGLPRILLLVATAERTRQDGDPVLALKLLRAAARRCWWADPGQEVRDRVVSAVESLPVSELEPEMIITLAAVAPLERGATVIERLTRLALDGDHDVVTACKLGTAATMVGALDQAAGFLTASVAGLRAQGRLGVLAQALVSLAFTSFHTVNWEVGLPAIEEAARLAGEQGQPRWAVEARIAQAQFAALRGDGETARAAASEAERASLPAANTSQLALIQIARGLLALGGGEYAQAHDFLARIFDPADPAHHPYLRTWAIGDLAEAAVRADRMPAAREALRALEPSAALTSAPLVQVNLRYAQALLAEDEDAEALYRTALDADLSRWPLARARLLLAYGSWLRRQRRTTEARTSLRIARVVFDSLGVAPWSERARQELRASGESSAQHSPGAWENLTPQELQIARMAADGLSNREIGAQLYLSPRTIGTYLYRIFPKLGISSRAQLRDRLAGPI